MKMAQSSTIAGVIVEDIARHLNCRLCRRLIRTPKLLPCLHSFCQVCIRGFAEKLAPGEFLACPLCETDAKVSKEELEDLPTNFFLDNMLDIALINSSDREPVPCSNCDSLNSPATSRCVDCGEFLCLNCYNVHKRIRQTKEHRILTISELLASKTGEDLHRPAFCRIHHSEPLKYYCETCNEAVCRDCVLIEHRQHKYDYIKDSKKIQKQKAVMENLFEECSGNIPFLEKSIKEIQSISDTLRGRLAAVKAEIREATLHQIKVLKEKERRLLMEADKIYNAKSPILKRQKDQLQDEFTKFKTGCDFSEQVLKYANEVELLSLKTPITERLTELNNTKLDCKPHENSELKYEVNSKEAEPVVAHSLGTLKTSGPHLVLEDMEVAPTMNGSTNGYSEDTVTREVPLSVELRDPNGVLLPPETIHQGKLLFTYADLDRPLRSICLIFPIRSQPWFLLPLIFSYLAQMIFFSPLRLVSIVTKLHSQHYWHDSPIKRKLLHSSLRRVTFLCFILTGCPFSFQKRWFEILNFYEW